MKRLYRSEKNKMVAGICGGLGEMFNIDPTLVSELNRSCFSAEHTGDFEKTKTKLLKVS